MSKNILLAFHEVADRSWFEKVIILLKSKYILVDMDCLEKLFLDKKYFSNICHITFDDGDKTFFNVAFPILKKYYVPATLFVSPEILTSTDNYWFQEVKDYDQKIMKRILLKELKISGDQVSNIPYKSILKRLTINEIKKIIAIYQKETKYRKQTSLNMSLNEVIEVEKSGLVTIGSHTLNHPILKNENDDTSYYEIARSIQKLQELLGHRIKYFAYPNGTPNVDFGEREMIFLRKNNISIAVSTESKFLTVSDNMLSLPRIIISNRNIFTIKLKLLLGSKWESIKSIRKLPPFVWTMKRGS